MRIGGVAAVAAAICLAGGAAHAQSSMVNGVKVAEVETAVALWYASTKFDVGLKDGAGVPLSDLRWSGINSLSADLSLKLNHLSYGVYARIWGGGGINFSGNLNDIDYDASGSVPISDTGSKLSQQGRYYFGADIGWTPWFENSWRLKVSPFVGLWYHHDTFDAKGITCNMPSGFGCPAAGVSFPGVGFDQEVIKNVVTFWAPRVGVAASYPVTTRISVTGELAYSFLGQYKNTDNHFLRTYPEFVDTGKSGNALQMQAMVDYKFAGSSWTLGAGFRYWKIESGTADAASQMSGVSQITGTSKNTLTTSGVIARANYQF